MATRQEAIDTLERGHAEIRRLTKQIPPHWMARPGVGGGEWTPKDLLGHLCFWEEKVLEALASWDAGERAPIDREIYPFDRGDQRGRCSGAVEAHARSGAPGLGQRARGADQGPQRDVGRPLGEPGDASGRKSLGHRMGQLLVGRGPFEHDDAHVKDLKEFVEAIPEGERSEFRARRAR